MDQRLLKEQKWEYLLLADVPSNMVLHVLICVKTFATAFSAIEWPQIKVNPHVNF